MRLALLLAVAVVSGVAIWLLSSKDDELRSAPQRPVGEARAPRSEPTVRKVPPKDVEVLRAALAAGEAHAAQDAAAALRRTLRGSLEARRHAEQLLLAQDTPSELRMALALVLGTLGGSDPALLDALKRFDADTDLVRCLIFALGATREPLEDDDVFGLGDRPWGVHGPEGLGITVRRSIEDAGVREAVAGHLGDSRGVVREAAAVALRHSTTIPLVRSEFLVALRVERSDDVALVLGEAMAVWAGSAEANAEQSEVVHLLLVRAADPGLDGFRFRMEDDFRRIALSPAHQATLAEYAQPARPYAVRSFALTALAPAAPQAARPLLEGFLIGDRDPAVRDLAARLLGTLPQTDRTIAVLAAASRDDKAWNVRYQAVDALGRFRADQEAAEAIRAAMADADARVAKLARALLSR